MPLVCLQFLIVIFPDHTHLLFLGSNFESKVFEFRKSANSLVLRKSEPQFEDSQSDGIHDFARKHLNVSSESMKRRYDVKMHKIAYKAEDAFWYYNSKQKVGFNPNLQRRLKETMNGVDILNDVYSELNLT